VGRINNVDLRQDIRIGAERLDLAVATQRDEHGIVVFGIAADRRVTELARLPLGYPDIYGICMRRTAEGHAEVFVNDKDGRFLQVRLERDAAGTWAARRLREFRLASQPEGCVADEAQGLLFVGEEKRGVWALSAEPANAQATDRRLVLPVGGLLHADVEGMAVHRRGASAYLVVSSQGNDSYVVLDAAPPHRVRGAFRVGMNPEAGVDGASETDGLDITAAPLGPAFPQGLLVVQDGRKRLPDGPQNFKYVSWDEVARALSLP
jgi:3-phytase